MKVSKNILLLLFLLLLPKSIYSQIKEYKLEDLVVVAKSKAQLRREAPSAVSVIDPKLIKMSFTGLQEVLGKASGTKMLKSGGMGSRSRILIQGLDGKRIGIFINGIPAGHADNFDFAGIPLDMVEQVEIYKGIIPALLGGDGLGGAVNIVMKNQTRDYLCASYEVGTFSTHQASLNGKKSLNDKGVYVDFNAMYNYSKNNYKFDSPFEPGRIIKRDHDMYRTYSSGIGVTFTKTWFDRLSAGLDYSTVHKQIQGGLMNLQNNVQHAFRQTNSARFVGSLSKKLFDDRLELSFDQILEKHHVCLVDTSHYAYDFNGRPYPSSSVQGEIGRVPHDSKDSHTNVRELLNINYRASDMLSFNLNTIYSYNNKDPKDKLADKYSKIAYSGYKNKVKSLISGLTCELRLMDERLVSETGIKYFNVDTKIYPSSSVVILIDKVRATEQNRTKWGWSEALSYHFDDNILLKASVQQSVRLPLAEELFGDGVYLLHSLSLEPEKSFGVNIGASVLANTLSYPNFRIEVNGFYMRVDDMIKMMYASMSMVYVNIGRALIKGIDAEIDSHLTPWLQFRGNISWHNAVDNRRSSPGGGGDNFHYKWRIPNMPYLFGNAAVIIEKKNLIARNADSSLNLDMEYTHRFSYGWEANSKNSLAVPTKQIWNLGMHQSFGKHISIGAEVRNLFDKKNWAEYRYPLPGRTFHMKLIYNI